MLFLFKMQPISLIQLVFQIEETYTKKIIFLFLGLAVPGISSYKKITEEYYTVPNQTILTSLSANSWTTSDLGLTCSASINFVANDVYQNKTDGILVYISFGNGVYEPMPQTYDGIAYSYTARRDRVVLEIQSSDAKVKITPPGPLNVKIVLIPSKE